METLKLVNNSQLDKSAQSSQKQGNTENSNESIVYMILGFYS